MNRMVRSSTIAATLLAAILLGACPNPSPPTPPTPPTWVQMHYPTPAGTWVTQPSLDANLLRILPVRGRAVRIEVSAALGTTFGVTLRELNGTLTALPQNPSGGVPAAGAGFFEVVTVNANVAPPIYALTVRAPAAIADPTNYDVMIVARSLTGGVADSAPLIVPLRVMPNFTVSVTIKGSGRVTSDLPGISCGTSQNICTAEFTAPVTLAAQSATSGSITFRSWDGSCTPNGQRCTVSSSGGRIAAVVANFQASTSVPVDASCPTPPTLHGQRWIAQPICSLSGTIQRDLKCDAQGYFCCAPSGPGGTPRCNGAPESLADCTHKAPNGQLIQPGGCYEATP